MNAASTSSFPVEGLAADIDHRKKRRNRTTHSCINCHTTKRKCDRKRPCSRCTQLGLTGLCVYEVDDPTVADDPNVDELTRLRKRIAELEGVIRELKNKPHPRWATQASSETPASFHTRSQHSRLVKKRKLENGDELYELDGAGGPSSVKLEGGHEFFSLDGHYTMGDGFRVGSDDAFSSPVSVRSADSPPITPVGCECLTNTAAYNALGDLDNYLRSAINTLAAVRHSPTSPDAPPTSPDERCAIYAEMARLQDLIAMSTRSAALAALPQQQQQQQQQVPQISQPSPPAHGRGGPLSVAVPLAFQASIAQGVPDSFNLRPPPPGGASAHYSAASSAPHTPNGLITPPLSSHSGTTSAHPWDSYSNGGSSPSPGLMGPPDAGHQHHVSSPALSATSSGTASTGYGAIPTTVQHELERDALNSLAAMGSYGQHQHQHHHQQQQQQPQFYAPQQTPHYAAAHDYDMTPSARSSFDSSYDFCGHAQHQQHNAYVLRAAAY